jgi:hypothetical protein
MSITEKATSAQPMDENLKRLITVAKGLEDTLLEYANYKPLKKVFNNNGEGKNKEIANDEAAKAKKFRGFIDKIFEFK